MVRAVLLIAFGMLLMNALTTPGTDPPPVDVCATRPAGDAGLPSLRPAADTVRCG